LEDSDMAERAISNTHIDQSMIRFIWLIDFCHQVEPGDVSEEREVQDDVSCILVLLIADFLLNTMSLLAH